MENAKTVIKDLLTDNWKSYNTDRITPRIMTATDIKRLDFTAYPTYITIYKPSPRVRKANGIGTLTVLTRDRVVINIMTVKSEDHADNCLDEAERIIDANIIGPHADYQWMNPDEDVQTLHDKTREFWRFEKTVELRNENQAR